MTPAVHHILQRQPHLAIPAYHIPYTHTLIWRSRFITYILNTPPRLAIPVRCWLAMQLRAESTLSERESTQGFVLGGLQQKKTVLRVTSWLAAWRTLGLIVGLGKAPQARKSQAVAKGLSWE